MQFQEVVQQEVEKIVADGTFSKIINEAVAKTVTGICGNLFSEYSDFGKSVKTAIGQKLDLSLDKLNMSAYTLMVCNTIEATLNGTVLESSIEKVKNHTRSVLQQIEKKKWSLSELTREFMKTHVGDGPSASDCHLEVIRYDWGSVIVSLRKGKNGSYGQESFELSLNKKDSAVYSITQGGNPMDPRKEGVMRFESLIMQLWANECIVEVDEDAAMEVIEYWGQHD